MIIFLFKYWLFHCSVVLTSCCSLWKQCLLVHTVRRLHHSDNLTLAHIHHPGNKTEHEQQLCDCCICVSVCVGPSYPPAGQSRVDTGSLVCSSCWGSLWGLYTTLPPSHTGSTPDLEDTPGHQLTSRVQTEILKNMSMHIVSGLSASCCLLENTIALLGEWVLYHKAADYRRWTAEQCHGFELAHGFVFCNLLHMSLSTLTMHSMVPSHLGHIQTV